jgi:solute carrier family 45 protein 1/2/4
LQAIITIIVGIGAPFLVSGNGVQPDHERAYTALGVEGQGQYRAAGGASRLGLHLPRTIPEAIGMAREVYERARAGTLVQVPIQGLTLVKLWSISMAIFAFAMACTW